MKPKRIGQPSKFRRAARTATNHRKLATVQIMNNFDDRNVLIEDVIDAFNFETVHVAMTALDWQWQTTAGNGHEVPSITRLKAMARHLLRESINNKVVASGGFEARYFPKVDDEPEQFTLQFILASADSDHD